MQMSCLLVAEGWSSRPPPSLVGPNFGWTWAAGKSIEWEKSKSDDWRNTSDDLTNTVASWIGHLIYCHDYCYDYVHYYCYEHRYDAVASHFNVCVCLLLFFSHLRTAIRSIFSVVKVTVYSHVLPTCLWGHFNSNWISRFE